MSGALDRAGRIRQAVDSVPDPELGGVTIGDLGLVVDVTVSATDAVDVALTPTFLGCPALGLIDADVRAAALTAGASSVEVRYVHVPMWSPSLISVRGRSQLAALGIGVPGTDGTVCTCPLCGEDALTSASTVGPTACRSVWWCSACRNVVEVMRSADRADHAEPVALGPSRLQAGQGPYVHV